jgi:hypothetical protein
MRMPHVAPQARPRSETRRPLRLDDSDGSAERAAEDAAAHVDSGGRLARSIASVSDRGRGVAPESVTDALREPGRPLASADRSGLEARFGADLGSVRVHDGARAARSASDVDAAAYSVGSHVVFGGGSYEPSSPRGRHLLAHELAHVVSGVRQPDAGLVVNRYRSKDSFAFGERNTKSLVEESFDTKKDKEKKPWIELVEVTFTGTQSDASGNVFSTGQAKVSYHANPVALPGFTFSISGGSGHMKTDAGSFTVHRIEGFGYNSGSASGTPGVDFKWSDREGPDKRYTKQDSTGFRAANMSFAVFYNAGEALHAGPLDFTSHGCVHVDWNNEDTIKQLNYHSVIGLTKVKVAYKGP